jgi:protein transport protein SEC24
LFVFTTGKQQFKNLQTFADLARNSSGSLYFYSEFDVYQHAMRFTNELYTCLTRASAWESVFRIRTSAGFNQVATYGNVLIKQKTADLLICPLMDKDRVYCYEIERTDINSVPVERRALLQGQTHLYL